MRNRIENVSATVAWIGGALIAVALISWQIDRLVWYLSDLDAHAWALLLYAISLIALLYCVVQTVVARVKPPPTQALPGAPPPAAGADPPPEGRRESDQRPVVYWLTILLQAWAPLYTFLFAVAMFAFGFIASSQIPKPSVGHSLVTLYAPTPTPTPTPEPTPTPAPTDTPAPLPSPGAGGAAPSPVPQTPAPRTASGATNSPTPKPTYAPVECAATLSIENGTVTSGGSGVVTYAIDCHGTPVLQPAIVPPVIVPQPSPAPTANPIDAPAAGPAKDFRWTWVVAAPKPPSASSSGTLGSGTESALYVSVSAPNPAPADFPASLPSQGTATTVAVRDKTTVDTLTSYVQGIAGFLGAVIALIAGLRNAHKP